MTRATVIAWLDERRPEPPPELLARLKHSVDDSDASESLPAHLARLGCELLDRVASVPDGGRELALDLLAADAFVTYAFEAQAEVAVDELTAVARTIAAWDSKMGYSR